LGTSSVFRDQELIPIVDHENYTYAAFSDSFHMLRVSNMTLQLQVCRVFFHQMTLAVFSSKKNTV
jgi:hypothetical protein